MDVLSAWRKLRWSVEHRGVAGTLRVAAGGLARRRGPSEPEPLHPFDAEHGTDTGGLIGGGSLAVGSRNDSFITAYAGIPPSRLQAALARWQASLPAGEPVESFTLVDLGCGKGRALLLASEWPFRAVMGVELNPGLAAVAQENVRRWEAAGKGRAPVTAACGDAVGVAYPAGPLLVFIYNSFGAPVTRAVLDALERHVRASGARVDVLYQNEAPETPLRTDPRLTLLWTGSLTMTGAERTADPVASEEDITGLYRWVGL